MPLKAAALTGSPPSLQWTRIVGSAQPAPHAAAIVSILVAKEVLKILLLPADDAVANYEERGENGKEYPERVEEERQSAKCEGLAEIVRMAAESIWAGDHQMLTCSPRGHRGPRPPKGLHHRTTEG
jgi:hypothetical protein